MTATTTAQPVTMLTGYIEKRKGFLGEGQSGPVTLEQARSVIGWMPYEASVSGTYITPEGVTTVQDPTRKMIVHPITGKPLGVHGEGYKVHGYEDTLLTDAARITDGRLDIGRVGVLGEGKRAYVQYEFDENVTTREGVEFRPFLNAATSLDGSIATSFFTGSQIIVCDNTLLMALKQSRKAGNILSIRHTRNSQVDVSLAREALKIVWQTADEFTAEIDKLTAEVVTDDQWNEFVKAMVPMPQDEGRAKTLAETKRGALNALWTTDERVAPWKGSAYGVLAATNTWANHVQTVRNVGRAERNVAKLIDGSFAKQDELTLKVLAEVKG